MRPLFLCALVGAALIMACSGGDSSNDGQHLLRFSGRDESEVNFRQRIAGLIVANNATFVPLCGRIVDLNAEGALAVLRDPVPLTPESIPGTTPKPGQTADEKDLVRSAVIVQEECARAFPH